MYTLQSAMKHSTDHNDEGYYAHGTDLSISYFVKKVLMVDPLQEYFGDELADESMESPNSTLI